MQFLHHDLTKEAVSPDKAGIYWDVPILVAADMASVASTSGATAFASVKNIEFRRSNASKLKMVEFLSNPHISASGFIGKRCYLMVLSCCCDCFFWGHCSEKPRIEEAFRGFRGFSFKFPSGYKFTLGDCRTFQFLGGVGIAIDLRNRNWNIRVEVPIFAIEYTLQVLGSANATAWYSPKQQEFMVEFRFFKT
ncbi:hypothetical protein TIFTF001_014176 [Ficus carica]|uniref:Uncharacterized protein n=1 Tax=Ficus carica TaxID=3494 RepID=A0AA88AJ62_FICCA|nr:hypothetical protein TIFTF001_014176 [Ficus carica]